MGLGSQKRDPGSKNGTQVSKTGPGSKKRDPFRDPKEDKIMVKKLGPEIESPSPKIESPCPDPGSQNRDLGPKIIGDPGPKIGDPGPENWDPYVSKVRVLMWYVYVLSKTNFYKFGFLMSR